VSKHVKNLIFYNDDLFKNFLTGVRKTALTLKRINKELTILINRELIR